MESKDARNPRLVEDGGVCHESERPRELAGALPGRVDRPILPLPVRMDNTQGLLAWRKHLPDKNTLRQVAWNATSFFHGLKFEAAVRRRQRQHRDLFHLAMRLQLKP